MFDLRPPCLQLGLEMSYWTAVNTLFVVGSLVMYFAVTFTMYSNGMFLALPSAFPFVGEWRPHACMSVCTSTSALEKSSARSSVRGPVRVKVEV